MRLAWPSAPRRPYFSPRTAAPVDDGPLELMALRDELPLELGDEHAEVGRVATGIHLRDEEYAHHADCRRPGRGSAVTAAERGRSGYVRGRGPTLPTPRAWYATIKAHRWHTPRATAAPHGITLESGWTP